MGRLPCGVMLGQARALHPCQGVFSGTVGLLYSGVEGPLPYRLTSAQADEDPIPAGGGAW